MKVKTNYQNEKMTDRAQLKSILHTCICKHTMRYRPLLELSFFSIQNALLQSMRISRGYHPLTNFRKKARVGKATDYVLN